jgi:hypothetical protein
MHIPHDLFSIQAKDERNRGIPSVKISTPYVGKIILHAAVAAEAQERIRFFQMMSNQPMFRPAAGVLFKRFVLSWMASDLGSLNCTPARGPSILKIPACGNRMVFFGNHTALKETKVDKLPFCLVPTCRTFAAIDMIILTVNSLITVQVTISAEHSEKESGFEQVKNSGIREDRQWQHIFITDDDNKARFLRSQALIYLSGDISVYSAVFNVGRSDTLVADIETFEVSGSCFHVFDAH